MKYYERGYAAANWRASCASRGLSQWWVVQVQVRHGHGKYQRFELEVAYQQHQEALVKRWAEGWVRYITRDRYWQVRRGSLKWLYVEVPY